MAERLDLDLTSLCQAFEAILPHSRCSEAILCYHFKQILNQSTWAHVQFELLQVELSAHPSDALTELLTALHNSIENASNVESP